MGARGFVRTCSLCKAPEPCSVPSRALISRGGLLPRMLLLLSEPASESLGPSWPGFPPPPTSDGRSTASHAWSLCTTQVLKGHDDHVITCLQFCGNRIVSGSDDNTLKVWSAVTGEVSLALLLLPQMVNGCIFPLHLCRLTSAQPI